MGKLFSWRPSWTSGMGKMTSLSCFWTSQRQLEICMLWSMQHTPTAFTKVTLTLSCHIASLIWVELKCSFLILQPANNLCSWSPQDRVPCISPSRDEACTLLSCLCRKEQMYRPKPVGNSSSSKPDLDFTLVSNCQLIEAYFCLAVLLTKSGLSQKSTILLEPS